VYCFFSVSFLGGFVMSQGTVGSRQYENHPALVLDTIYAVNDFNLAVGGPEATTNGGGYLRVHIINETWTITGNATTASLTETIPKGAIILAVAGVAGPVGGVPTTANYDVGSTGVDTDDYADGVLIAEDTSWTHADGNGFSEIGVPAAAAITIVVTANAAPDAGDDDTIYVSGRVMVWFLAPVGPSAYLA